MSGAQAQSECPKPVVSVVRNGETITATGAAMAPAVRLQLSSDPACADKLRYQCQYAELTLMRAGRPVLPAIRAYKPNVDLSAWVRAARPSDRIYVFVPYANLTVVAPDGSRQPYTRPEPAKPTYPDMRTDAAKGVSFSWQLLP
ncbi:hypothetical protein [Hymenobacter latericus]|uniref:hypothetical protein n=1 Tax=Hymenobacter sp. YIM 151858-1 TaxID=2987688 RepID=UPI002227F121|nr:hypothetical protein [Hymenobacter sp. YIM 151858-1]UYZ60750.1 hypothetical protein OIS50_08095 [Hymenobacter sp. YIM 151858-1]